MLFRDNLHQKEWGGQRISEIKNPDATADIRYGESWEITTNEEAPSTVCNGTLAGKTICELEETCGQDLLGKDKATEHIRTVKLINTGNGITRMAPQTIHRALYVVECDRNTQLTTDTDEVRELQPGDLVVVPRDTAVCINKPALLAEIMPNACNQQPTEEILNELSLIRADLMVNHYTPLLSTASLAVGIRLFDREMPMLRTETDSYAIYTSLKGYCRISMANDNDDTSDILLREGYTCLIPACVKRFTIYPLGSEVKLLVAD